MPGHTPAFRSIVPVLQGCTHGELYGVGTWCKTGPSLLGNSGPGNRIAAYFTIILRRFGEMVLGVGGSIGTVCIRGDRVREPPMLRSM